MRLKTYTAPTMSEAMEIVRADMGDDAIIVSTQQGADGLACRVTAAIEEEEISDLPLPATDEDDDLIDQVDDVAAYLRQVLTAHGMPQNLSDVLVRVAEASASKNPTLALAEAIDARLSFRPIELSQQRRAIVLAGPPGAGKTITTAKMAAQSKLAGRIPFIATADAKRAGGIAQLQAFTDILEIDLIAVAGADALSSHLESIENAPVALIDTAGINPFDDTEMAYVADIATAIDGELVLVLPAGGDALESADIAAAFRDLGAERMILTRLDMTRRLGGIAAAALAGGLQIANVSINPQVADGLTELNPVSLARLIIPDEEPAEGERQTRVAQ